MLLGAGFDSGSASVLPPLSLSRSPSLSLRVRACVRACVCALMLAHLPLAGLLVCLLVLRAEVCMHVSVLMNTCAYAEMGLLELLSDLDLHGNQLSILPDQIGASHDSRPHG